MKKQLLLLVVILLPLVAWSETVEIDGIYYSYHPKTKLAEVVSGDNPYSGDILGIREVITVNNEDYAVTAIGESAFALNNINTISLPSSIRTIDEKAFYYSSVSSIIIPNGVRYIRKDAFSGCKQLENIELPESVEIIEQNVFSQCTQLKSITIPNRVKTIDRYSFMGCINLEEVVLPIGLEIIKEGAFNNCAFESIEIPNSVVYIYGNSFATFCGAFSECKNLKEIILPEEITFVDTNTFYGCINLKTVYIPTLVTNIYASAFEKCENLTDVYCFAENIPSTYNNVFKDAYIEFATLHVRETSIELYKEALPWNNFKSIEKIDIPKHSLKYIVDNEEYVSYEVEEGLTISPEPEPKKEGYSFSGWFGLPQRMPTNDVIVNGYFTAASKCASPIIHYENGQLKFTCATEGAEFITDITDTDIKRHYESTISLTATYCISVYATKSGYDNSEVTTATLCWIDKEPTSEDITDGVAQIPSKAVLIQSEGGFLKVEGIDEGTQVLVYTPDGKQAGSAVCRNGAALVGTSIRPGNTAIVKIGEKSVKVIMK